MSTISGGCNPCCAPTVNGILPTKANANEEAPITDECIETICVHFDQYATGTAEPNLLFPGFTIYTDQNPVTNPLMIFDSAAPTAGHEDLGTPNETCCDTPGPGVGSAGEKGTPGENCIEQKKVLIISDNPPAPGAPVPKPDGGLITLEFMENVRTCEVHLLNVAPAPPCGYVRIYDFNDVLLAKKAIAGLGENSFQIVEIVPAPGKKVRKLTIELVNDAAVAKIVYKMCPNPGRACMELVCEDFEEFAEGATFIPINGGNITTDDPVPHPPMIFNSSAPTGGDVELGSPNTTCAPPGPGIGAGGEVGEPGENCNALGKILIISEDANPVVPQANAGGQFIINFTKPVSFKEIHFLNAATDGDTVTIYDEDGFPIDVLDIPNVGANGFAKIQSPNPYPVNKVVVEVSGKTAIAKLVYCVCRGGGNGGKEEVVQLLDNAITPVEILCTDQQGTYILMVESVDPDGAKATFMASSAFNAQAGHVVRLSAAPSLTDERIHIQWNANERIKLFHDITKTGGVGALIPYNVLIKTL